jgi:hypothetical protein
MCVAQIMQVVKTSIMDDVLVRTNDHRVQTYSVINHHDAKERATGFQIVVLELAKCRKLRNLDIQKPLDRWIQYFINPEYYLAMEKQELEQMPYQRKAVEILDTTNFTPGQMRAYDQYIDSVRLHNTIMEDAWERGIREGNAKGLAEGRAEGEQTAYHNILAIIEDLNSGMTAEVVAEKYNASLQLVEKLVSR